MKNEASANLDFLRGGGEMGRLMREKNWGETPMGDTANWPQSLRTTLGIIINSKFPMLVMWGPQLLCFYNDAFRPSLGTNGKHPDMLGQEGEEAWKEIWHIINPLLQQVLSGGGATWSEDQLVPFYRNGKIEEIYWTFSYSPVNDESDKPSGVLVTCYETTDKVKGLAAMGDREEQLNFTLDAAELATWDLNPQTNKFLGSERLKEWFGIREEDEIQLPVALNAIVESDRERVANAIKHALQYESGGYYNIEYTIKNQVTARERFVLAKGRALFDNDHIAYRFSGILQDITEQVVAAKIIAKKEKEFRNTVKQIDIGITIFRGPDFIVDMVNDAYLQLVDREEKDFVGKPLFESLPEVKDAVNSLLTEVLNTGVPFYATEFPVTLNRYGKHEYGYFNLAYQPYKEEDGTISGVIVVATEVTESVKAKHALAESEKQFRNLVMQSPIPMTILRGRNHVIEVANRVMYEKIWRKKEGELIGRSILEAFPELMDQKYAELLNKVFSSGVPHREKESIAYVQGDDGMQAFYLDYEYAPLLDTSANVSGIMITVNDVTEKVIAREKVEEAEERLRLALEATELSTWDLDLESRTIIYSPRLAMIFGHPESFVLTHQEMRNQVHPDDLHAIVEPAFEVAMRTGFYFYEARAIRPDKSICWIRTQGKVFFDERKRAVKLIGTLQDITADKSHQDELLEREKKFRMLADSMPQFVWTSDSDGNLDYFNHAVYDYSGLTPEEVFAEGWLQIVHPDDRNENVSRWMDAIKSGKPFLFEHRFRRYDGEFRWQLSRAIPQKDTNGKIQMWVGTSTDIQEQKAFATELKKQVQEQTGELLDKNKELEKMNAELKSFAYVSSHDLQEPLRKIQTFASRIIEKELANLSDKGKDYFSRMNEAAKRMQTLIEDLLTYSRTSTSDREFSLVSLADIINEVKSELKDTFIEKRATLRINDQCKVNIVPFQFRQLMHNLIGNSLKFSNPQRSLLIKISCEPMQGADYENIGLSPDHAYCHIAVSDNGIGFDPQYKERIFEVFQRLHGKEEYKGTGIGLSIVKKIVENHNGIITANGVVGEGAMFDMYIPA